jgi:hypothetical protein
MIARMQYGENSVTLARQSSMDFRRWKDSRIVASGHLFD